MEKEKWRKFILKSEGLEKWKIKDCQGGGLCQHKIKTIICPSYNQALFLHEVAHALLPKRGHDAVWADIFTELCRRYLSLPQGKSVENKIIPH